MLPKTGNSYALDRINTRELARRIDQQIDHARLPDIIARRRFKLNQRLDELFNFCLTILEAQ